MTHRRRVPDQFVTYGKYSLLQSYGNQALKTHLNSFHASPYCSCLIGDVGDITQKMLPFNATVPNVSLSLHRQCVTDCYNHMETRLYLCYLLSYSCLIFYFLFLTQATTLLRDLIVAASKIGLYEICFD